MPNVSSFIASLNVSFPLLILLCIALIPIVLLIVIVYTGIYYHLWYFPAVIFSLLLLSKWKKKFDAKYVLIISFILLLFGATETYYGALPSGFQKLLIYYYNIFFTTRNFLLLGLFYVVLGYLWAEKKKSIQNIALKNQ